jgi:hypothetical protein
MTVVSLPDEYWNETAVKPAITDHHPKQPSQFLEFSTLGQRGGDSPISPCVQQSQVTSVAHYISARSCSALRNRAMAFGACRRDVMLAVHDAMPTVLRGGSGAGGTYAASGTNSLR